MGVQGERGGLEAVFSSNNGGAGGGNGGVELPDVDSGTGWGEIKMRFRGSGYATNCRGKPNS